MILSEVSMELGSKIHNLHSYLQVNYTIVWESKETKLSIADQNNGILLLIPRLKSHISQNNTRLLTCFLEKR